MGVRTDIESVLTRLQSVLHAPFTRRGADVSFTSFSSPCLRTQAHRPRANNSFQTDLRMKGDLTPSSPLPRAIQFSAPFADFLTLLHIISHSEPRIRSQFSNLGRSPCSQDDKKPAHHLLSLGSAGIHPGTYHARNSLLAKTCHSGGNQPCPNAMLVGPVRSAFNAQSYQGVFRYHRDESCQLRDDGIFPREGVPVQPCCPD